MSERVLAHEIRGAGSRPALLLHGFLGSGRNLASLARQWTARDPGRRLALADLTGHGDSPPLPENASLDDLAADVLALLDRLGIVEAVPIVGHSLGGRVALAAARRSPGRVASVTLLDIPPGPLPKAGGTTVLSLLMEAPPRFTDRAAGRAWFTGRGLPGPLADWLTMNLVRDPAGDGLRWRIDREALAAFHARQNAEDLWPVVVGGALPVTCIRGGASDYVGEDDVRRFEAAGAKLVTLPGAGHFVHVDALDALVDRLAA
jgi:esterase